jgi:hypothetical protein
MPMERIRRSQALSKFEFHKRLRDWLDDTDDAFIGPESIDGRTGWIHVHDGSNVFVLHADTGRDAVRQYLQTVAVHRNDLGWEITQSQRGNMTAVVYGPKKIRYKSFYFYVANGPRVAPGYGRKSTKTKGAPQNYHTITINTAIEAIKAYNSGTYNGVGNIDLDLRGRRMFAGGLGATFEQVLEQLHFIGRDYGGVAGFPVALALTPTVADAIWADRDDYASAAKSAHPLVHGASSIATITYLLKPFVRSLHGKRNWQVWASKFWHFLNCDAFLIEDSRVDRFFELVGRPSSAQKYFTLLQRFRDFEVSHRSWVEQLRAADHGHASCDNKLWDKVFYGVSELDEVPESPVTPTIQGQTAT